MLKENNSENEIVIHFFVKSKLFQKRKPTTKLQIIFKSDGAVLF